MMLWTLKIGTQFVQLLLPTGQYNITQNETCRNSWQISEDSCKFRYTSWVFHKEQQSLIIFMKNRISEQIVQVGLQIYESKCTVVKSNPEMICRSTLRNFKHFYRTPRLKDPHDSLPQINRNRSCRSSWSRSGSACWRWSWWCSEWPTTSRTGNGSSWRWPISTLATPAPWTTTWSTKRSGSGWWTACVTRSSCLGSGWDPAGPATMAMTCRRRPLARVPCGTAPWPRYRVPGWVCIVLFYFEEFVCTELSWELLFS